MTRNTPKSAKISILKKSYETQSKNNVSLGDEEIHTVQNKIMKLPDGGNIPFFIYRL